MLKGSLVSGPDPSKPPTLESSALLRWAVDHDHPHVGDFLPPGDYPGLQKTKSEVESRVEVLTATRGENDRRLLAKYLAAMFPEDALASDKTELGIRQRGFAALQLELDKALNELDARRMGNPAPGDRLFANLPSLFDELDPRDHMLTLRPDHLNEATWLGALPAIHYSGYAVYLHPRLAMLRELVHELAELVSDPDLRVRVALDPFRITAAEDFGCRLLEDYWMGIKMSPAILDSLDSHDVGNPTFHAAVNRSPAEELLNPLLGTWFDWDGRGDDAEDPVKRLYVQEVRPSTDRRGRDIACVINRELHAERDTSSRSFVHVDGKAVAYDVTAYGPSAENPTIRPSTPAATRKLWRVDGRLTNEQWATLVGLHFRGNELIEEHLAMVLGTSP